MHRLLVAGALALGWGLAGPLSLRAQEPAADTAEPAPVRGSIVEDRAARKLLEAGDARYESGEDAKAVEVWQSVIERYPRSRVRYEAHMRLGRHLLERERAYEKARAHFQAVAAEENGDDAQRAEATLRTGVCFYEARNYGMCFQIMRDVIEKYPSSPQVNEAYYHIGLGHFQLGHYSRAIAALERVGTTLAGEEGKVEKVEAGKRIFVKIDDADLAALEPGQAVKVRCESTGGDVEVVECLPIGRNVRVVLGSVTTRLGRPSPYDGTLDVRGDDRLKLTYVDRHTSDKQFDRDVVREVTVVGDAVVTITDGAFRETLKGVVLGKGVSVQIADADRDLTDGADTIAAVVEVWRRKTDDEVAAESAKAAAEGRIPSPAESDEDDLAGPKIDLFRKIDSVPVTLNETHVERQVKAAATNEGPTGDTEAAQAAAGSLSSAGTVPGTPPDDSIHSGFFRTTVPLAVAETATEGDAALQALPGDVVRVTYLDERHTGEEAIDRLAEAQCVDGNLGGVRVTRAVISDQELRIQTQLKTAGALTNIGNRYKEFGLKDNAAAKYEQALAVCEEILKDASRLGGRLLEETYVQLWKVYYEMDKLDLAAAMAERLQREFPNSGFVDDALLQLADVARKQGNLERAVGIYQRLVAMPTSQLRGDAQFGVAACYDAMAESAPEAGKAALLDRAFQEYKKVFDNHPDSGRVGEAVAKMANYYYQQKDYARAVDTFETVLADHPDAKFLDVILFNYGRCLYRMNRQAVARQKFDQLIAEFPESPLAADAKKISDALAKSGF